MKNKCNTVFLLTICLFLGITTKAQLYVKQSKSAYLFYQTSHLRQLPFTYKASETELMQFKTKKDSIVDVVVDSINAGICYGHFIFHKSVDARDFRFVLRRLGQSSMYVNDVKILQQSLFTELELQNSKQVVFDVDESKLSANSLREANALHAKLFYARMHNYTKHLYSGEITKLEEAITVVLNSIRGK